MIGGVYWFITVLLISEVIIVIIENHINNNRIKIMIYCLFYIVAICESLLFIPSDTINIPIYMKLPWNIDVALISIPYLSIGIFLRKNPKIIIVLKSKEGIALSLLCIIAFCLFLYYCNAINWLIIDMKYSQYRNIMLDILCPIIAGLCLWYIAKIINISKLKVIISPISYFGQQSLAIMYLHLLIRDKIVVNLFGENYPIVIYISIVLFVSCIWTLLANRIPTVAKIFGVCPCLSSRTVLPHST